MATPINRTAIGQAKRRKEDFRFLTGNGSYTADMVFEGQTEAVVMRSPHAHARILSIDTADARTRPGVIAIFTSDDIEAAGLGTIPCLYDPMEPLGSTMITPPRRLLARGIVRHVGDPVVFVVAETAAQARDASEFVVIDYEPLPAITDAKAATAPGAPQLWAQASANTSFNWEKGDRASTDAAFEAADHVVELDLINNRLVANPMEPRNAIGIWDEERFTLYSGTQGVHLVHRQLANHIFNLPEDRIRVVTPDVGGGFGTKGFFYPEQALVLFAAREVGRPVRWIGDRTDSFLSDAQGRDHITRAELALDTNAKFLAIRVRTFVNLGAYLSNYGAAIPTGEYAGLLAGVYTLPSAHVEVRGVFTNTVQTDAYRGAGRPESIYVVERVVDAAARQLGIDPIAIRERNFIPTSALPHTTPMGLVYDSGDFARTSAEALRRADHVKFIERKKISEAAGKLRGLGLAYYIESCGAGATETADIRFDRSGTAAVLIGTQSNGQGHETAYAQIIADRLGLDIGDITVVQGDSDRIKNGTGTSGSRSMPIGGVCCDRAAAAIIEKGKKIAARELEVAIADIEFTTGEFRVSGTDRSVTLAQTADAAYKTANVLDGNEPGLAAIGQFGTSDSTFSNGCHICEIEIDPETGVSTIDRYTIVDDLGTVINPMLLTGQVQGGTIQGIGQALFEGCKYQEDDGQLVTGSFMDYCLPRADDVPFIDFQVLDDMPCKTNPMGMKGAGEVGAIGGPPAVINALLDAMSGIGVDNIDMPASPEKVWALVAQAKLARV
jgi:aerobic carbon-monoxide dehydrogenase large subunit